MGRIPIGGKHIGIRNESQLPRDSIAFLEEEPGIHLSQLAGSSKPSKSSKETFDSIVAASSASNSWMFFISF